MGSASIRTGATFYQSTSRAGITNPAGAIALAEKQHLDTIRVADCLDHGWAPARAEDPTTWDEVDTLIADAEKANIKVLLDLSDFKAMLWHSCVMPYDASLWTYDLSWIATRVNSVTGVQYSPDPGIVLVTFTGEPLPVGIHVVKGSSVGNCTLTYTTVQLTSFYAGVESDWKAKDPNHLLAAGGLGYVNEANTGIDWQAIFSNPNNDVCAWKTYGGMYAWLRTGARYCRSTLAKPWFNDEWGYKQRDGDSARASEFDAQFAHNAANGAAGNFFWNSNSQVDPTTFDVGPGTPLTQAAVVSHAPS